MLCKAPGMSPGRRAADPDHLNLARGWYKEALESWASNGSRTRSATRPPAAARAEQCRGRAGDGGRSWPCGD